MPHEQRVVGGPRQPQQVGVAHGVHGSRARFAGQKGDVADGSAAPDLLEHALAAVAVGDGDAQPTVTDEEHVVAGVAFPEQPLAAAQLHPFELRGDVGQHVALERAEHLGQQVRELGSAHPRHDAAQELVERLGMPQREPLEVLARHAREIGVLDGEHGRRARLAREERHLADETARAHFVDQRRRAVRVLRADAQASAQDQVDVAVGVALAQQRRAAGERRVAQHAAAGPRTRRP